MLASTTELDRDLIQIVSHPYRCIGIYRSLAIMDRALVRCYSIQQRSRRRRD